MSGWTTRAAPVMIVLAVLFVLTGDQLGVAHQAGQDLATPVVDSTEPPDAGAGPGTDGDISTLAAYAIISHSFSNPTPSAGETITVTVTVSGNSDVAELLRFFENVYPRSSPFVLGEPQVGNLQNTVITSNPQQAPDGYEMEVGVPAPGQFGFTFTYTVAIDPAAIGPLRFYGWVQYLDGTHIGDNIVSLPVTPPPTNTPRPTVTNTPSPPTNTPEPTSTSASTTTSATVAHALPSDTSCAGDTITVSVTVAGEATADDYLRLFETAATPTTPIVRGQSQLSNQQNVEIGAHNDAPGNTYSAFSYVDFLVTETGHFELTLTYTLTIDPNETAPLDFEAQVYFQSSGSEMLAEDIDTLPLCAVTTPTNTSLPPTDTPMPPTNTPEPTVSCTGATVDVIGLLTPAFGNDCTPVPPTSTSTAPPPTEPRPTATSPVTILPETGKGQQGSSATWVLLAAACLLLAGAGAIVRRARQPTER